jgi:hypothetical protein
MLKISENGTTKRKPRLAFDGYPYVKHQTTTEKVYWRCIKYSSDHCHSRLHTFVHINTVVKPPSEHTCTFDGTTNELGLFNEEIAHRAMNTQETPDTIVTDCYKSKAKEAL